MIFNPVVSGEGSEIEPIMEYLDANKIQITPIGDQGEETLFEFTLTNPVSELIGLVMASRTQASPVTAHILAYPTQRNQERQAVINGGGALFLGTPEISGNKVSVIMNRFGYVLTPSWAYIQYTT